MNLRHYELANERKLKFGENAPDCHDDPVGDISVPLLAKPSGEPRRSGFNWDLGREGRGADDAG